MQLKTECGSQFTNKLEGMFKVCVVFDIIDSIRNVWFLFFVPLKNV